MNTRKGMLIVVSGFAGTGKGTLMKMLTERSDRFALSVSMTTRSPRPGEKEGVSYFFTDKAGFEETIAKDGFLEYASYCGNYYGTPKAYVEKMRGEGKDVILEIELQGATRIKEKYPETLLLFILPPSIVELKNRLLTRGTETPEVIEKRLSRAAKEAEGIGGYDYVLINDDLETCYTQLLTVIEAARLHTGRNKEFISEIQKELQKEELKGEI